MLGDKRIHCLGFLIFTIGLSGCAGVWVSSSPVYPESWPALVALDTGRTCPDLSGKYRAVSDEAAPLVYPTGGHPREMFMFATYGKLWPVPPLGRRILPWHLAGIFKNRDHDMWSALTSYADKVEPDATLSNPKDESSWVQIQQLPDNLIEVRAGLHDKILLNFSIRKETQGFLISKSQVYKCQDGGLVIVNNFPPPTIEDPNPTAPPDFIGARLTFYRTADGSLVALEDPYAGANLVFKKWWKWQRIE